MFSRSLSVIFSTVQALVLMSFLMSCQSVDLKELNEQLSSARPLDNKTIVAGLKQALEVGTKNSVNLTSQKGGFSDNSLIRINTPKELDKLVNTLNKLGLSRYVDSFELQMNRAAETASAEAKQVFFNSISNMSLRDGLNILQGPDDAATQFFRKTSTQELSKKFKPIITQSMSRIGFYDDYKKMLKTYDAIPFTKKPDLNIESYLLQQTLDGLFTMLAKEESKIRKDPAARVTELLRRVFG